MKVPAGSLELVGAPAPSPPELVSKLPFDQFPFCTFPKPPHTPDLGVGGFERAAPSAADPEKNNVAFEFELKSSGD